MNNKNRRLTMAGIYFVLFLLLIVLVKTVDVAQIGPEGTSIGLSHINNAVHQVFGVNLIWYNLTEIFGILAILVVGCFGVMGLVQLIQRKSLLKVDKEILCLGGLYVVVLAAYAFFEKVIVNYRPIIEDGAEHVEASFPSSHTMLIVTVFGTLVLVIDRFIQKEIMQKAARIVNLIIICLTIVGRLICGVHWFTDILGGCLISLCFINLFDWACKKVTQK